MSTNRARVRPVALLATVLVAVLAVAVLVVGGAVGTRHFSQHSADALTSKAATSKAATTPVTAVSPVWHGLLAPQANPLTPAPRHDVVAASPPTSFEIAGAAFDVKANVCQMPYVRPLDPPGDQHHTVCWVKSDFGVAPGSNSGGTSYILGHSWSKEKLVFNPLSELAMKQVDDEAATLRSNIPTYPVTSMDGYTITLGTATGTLIYKVTDAFAVSKQQAGNVASIMTNVPNRVLLITCGVSGDVDADVNIIVDAYLQSSTAR